ncbi:TPA: hypothetical protein ACP32N_003298, partial [Pseudomonas aeruginosa]
CGFGSWDVMAYAMESMPPSVADEDLEPEEYRDRLKGQLRILVREHELDPGEAMMLLGLLPPTSRQPHKAFTMADSADFSAQQLLAFREYAGEIANDLSDAFPSELVQSIIQNKVFERAERSRASVAITLSGHTNPISWMAIFNALEWEFEFTDDELPDLDEPSFSIFDDSLGDIPVYLSPIARAPMRPNSPPADRAQRVQRALCVGDYVTNWQSHSSVALLLQRWPVVNEVDDKLYCHLGSVYHGETNQWTDLLFNLKCTSVAKLLKLNARVKDIQKGCPELVDTDEEFSSLATICLSGIDLDDFPEGSLEVVRSKLPKSRWMVQRALEEDDSDE